MEYDGDNVKTGNIKREGKVYTRCRWSITNKHLWMTLNSSLRWFIAFLTGALGMLLFRATVATLCVVEGDALAPLLIAGDRVVVNRWSYGLRTGGKNSIFDYGRIGRQPVGKGDIVAIEWKEGNGGIVLCRCVALPGDTITVRQQQLIVPGKVATCADEDYYLMETMGRRASGEESRAIIADSHILGKAVGILFSHDDSKAPMKGFRKERSFTSIHP